MGDADERAQKVECVDLFANVAALDGALYQCINRSLNLSRGTFEQLLRNLRRSSSVPEQ